jgi:hypothetical protein
MKSHAIRSDKNPRKLMENDKFNEFVCCVTLKLGSVEGPTKTDSIQRKIAATGSIGRSSEIDGSCARCQPSRLGTTEQY